MAWEGEQLAEHWERVRWHTVSSDVDMGHLRCVVAIVAELILLGRAQELDYEVTYLVVGFAQVGSGLR